MTAKIKSVASDFEKFKRQLNAAYSYVIFETTGASSSAEAEFEPVFDVIARLKLSTHHWECFHDEARGRLQLVVRFDPGRTDEIMQELLNVGLPANITVYAYGSPAAE